MPRHLTPDEPYEPAEEAEAILGSTDPRDARRDRGHANRHAIGGWVGGPPGFVGYGRPRGEERRRQMANYEEELERQEGGRGGRERSQDLKQTIQRTIKDLEQGAPVSKEQIERIVLMGLLEAMDQHRIPTRLQAARMLGETVGMFKKVQVSETPAGILEQLNRLERTLAIGARTVEAEVLPARVEDRGREQGRDPVQLDSTTAPKARPPRPLRRKDT